RRWRPCQLRGSPAGSRAKRRATLSGRCDRRRSRCEFSSKSCSPTLGCRKSLPSGQHWTEILVVGAVSITQRAELKKRSHVAKKGRSRRRRYLRFGGWRGGDRKLWYIPVF